MLHSVLFGLQRFVPLFVLLLVLLVVPLAPCSRADIAIDRDIMTVTTDNLIAMFRGPDLLRLTNRLTNEQYLRAPTPYKSMLDLGLLEPTGRPLTGDFWRRGRNEQAAQYVAKDLTRTVTINVIIDPDTQDITLTMWGESLKEGATGLTWGLRGLDLTGGRLVMPVLGGRCADEHTPFEDLNFPYPAAWEAQMIVWEDKLSGGGFVIYSRDDELRYKRLHVTRHGPRADLAFETEAQAPWERNGSVPAVEWRINTYKGDWRVPAAGYRNLMTFLRPPVPLTGSRAWVKDIRTVVSIPGKELNRGMVDSMARSLAPRRTLLFLPDWRRDGYDANIADYTPREGVQDFAARAHEMGFHIMLPIEPPGSNPQSGDFSRAQRLLVKDSIKGKRPVSIAPSFANFNPASKAYRDLVVARVKVMMDDVAPDVLYLPGAGTLPNDGNGVIEKKSFSLGAVALHRALLTAFPDLLLAGEGTNEMIAPYSTVALRTASSSLPPHPISTMLFSNTTFMSSLLPGSGAETSGTDQHIRLLDEQGVFPVVLISSPADLAKPGPSLARLLKLAKTWQDRDMLPDWTGSWYGLLMRWRGADGKVITSERKGNMVVVKLGDEALSERPSKPGAADNRTGK